MAQQQYAVKRQQDDWTPPLFDFIPIVIFRFVLLALFSFYLHFWLFYICFAQSSGKRWQKSKLRKLFIWEMDINQQLVNIFFCLRWLLMCNYTIELENGKCERKYKQDFLCYFKRSLSKCLHIITFKLLYIYINFPKLCTPW